MKATDFVREFTVFGAKEYLAGATFYKDRLMVFTDIDDLKQIVDAFELVDRFGGYDSVLNMVNNPTCFGDSNFEIEIKLNEAINLVEQCQK